MRLLILISFLVYLNSSAQATWQPLTNSVSNTNNQRFDDVFFINENIGWAANGYYATVYKTIDGGKTWTKQLDETELDGDYYFRNIDDRILFGGGRNLDFETEETTIMEETKLVQNKLEELLRSTILPNTYFEIDHKWSGIMGVGNQKKPIVKQISNHVYCGVRLGGMGVAIGSTIGMQLAQLLD